MARSFADPETEFLLERSGSPVNVDGHKLGAPTGHVICTKCCRVSDNIDEITHETTCPQHDVHSEYWRRTHDS